jgi:hypothetical protein
LRAYIVNLLKVGSELDKIMEVLQMG